MMLDLDNKLNELFDKYGMSAILYSLARRCRDESSICFGEERGVRARHWEVLAEDLEDIYEDLGDGLGDGVDNN
jgi:hypothetical protein